MTSGDAWRPRPRSLVPPAPGQSVCSVCEEPLTPHQAVSGGVCDHPFCRRDLAVRQAGEAKRRREREQLTLARAWYSRLRRGDGDRFPGNALVAVLPLNRQPLVLLPAERREAIRAHLTAALSEAKARAAELEPGEWEAPRPPFAYDIREDELPVLGAACETCRGQCCVVGGDHAFLSSDVFIPRLLADPGLTTDDLLQEYLDHLPVTHFRNQCVYQADEGCGLPREKRSGTCNSFLCNSLLKLGRNLTAAGPRHVFGVTMDGTSIRGGALLDDDQLEFRVGPHPETTTFR